MADHVAAYIGVLCDTSAMPGLSQREHTPAE